MLTHGLISNREQSFQSNASIEQQIAFNAAFKDPVHSLTHNNKLQKQALDKATLLVRMLKEDNYKLNVQINELKQQQKQTIALLQQQHKQREMSLKAQINLLNTHNRKLKRNSSQTKSLIKKSQTKVVNSDNPNCYFFKDNEHIQFKIPSLLNLVNLPTKQQIDAQLKTYVEEEGLIYGQYQEIVKQMEEQIDDFFKVWWGNNGVEKTGDQKYNVLSKYKEIIEKYKEYSDYLRAYLCQSISFIHQYIDEDPISLDYLLQPELLQVIVRKVVQAVSKKVQHLKTQNQDLRVILDQMIAHLTSKDHEQQTHIEHISKLSSGINYFMESSHSET